MKKAISFLLTILLIFSFTACSSNSSKSINDSAYIKSYQSDGDKIESINVSLNNSIGNQYDSSTYLTEDYFFYTSYDENSSFGNGSKLMKYNLHTADVEPINKDFYIGDVHNMLVVDECLYFTTYAETGATDEEGTLPGGFCLFEYNIRKDSVEKIYATPNTIEQIYPFVINNKLYFVASTAKQNGDDFHLNLYSYKNKHYEIIWDFTDEYKIARDYYCVNVESDGNNKTIMHLEDNKSEFAYNLYINEKGVYKQEKCEIKENAEFNCDYRTFGEWKIVSTTVKSTEDEAGDQDCGYEYSVLYSISNGKENYSLSNAAYWFYYI